MPTKKYRVETDKGSYIVEVEDSTEEKPKSDIPDPKIFEKDTILDTAGKFGTGVVRGINPFNAIPSMKDIAHNVNNPNLLQNVGDPNEKLKSMADPSRAGEAVGNTLLSAALPAFGRRIAPSVGRGLKSMGSGADNAAALIEKHPGVGMAAGAVDLLQGRPPVEALGIMAAAPMMPPALRGVGRGLKAAGRALGSDPELFGRGGQLPTEVAPLISQSGTSGPIRVQPPVPRPTFGTGGSLPTDMGSPPQSGGPIQVTPPVPRPTFGSGGSIPTEVGLPPQSGGPIRITPRPTFGSGGRIPMEVGDIPQSGGPIQVRPPVPRPAFGSGGAIPMEVGDVPQSGGPIQVTPPIPRPTFGSGGQLPTDIGTIPQSGGPIQIPGAPPRLFGSGGRIPTDTAPLSGGAQRPEGIFSNLTAEPQVTTPTAMSPRLAGKAPALESTLQGILEEAQKAAEKAQTSTLAPAPGSEITPSMGKHESVGKKVKVGATSGNPSKTAAQMEEVSKPPTSMDELAGEQPDYVKAMQQIMARENPVSESPVSRIESSVRDIASRSSREMSPIKGLSLEDLGRLATLIDDPILKEQLLKLRAEGQQGHISHSRMDAAAKAALEREK